MADGKITLPYKQFLGYDKGEDGMPRIIEKEAAIVRRIFRQYLQGKTFSTIARLLEKDGIPAPAGGRMWQSATVRSIRSSHSLECQEASDHQSYLERYEQAGKRLETLEREKLGRTAKSKTIGRFIRSIRGTSSLITEFDETLWVAIADSVTVVNGVGMVFHFKNGLESIDRM